ncbi:MAG TPA: Zn-dependent hydrolase [Gemmatimonadales bacterium]|nr:Zn-dependent hydrolase [Gemmatimonadales bacterium]
MMDRRTFAIALTAAGLIPPSRRGAAQADWRAWRVNGARVNGHLAALSRFGRTPEGGVSRVAFSEADLAGRAFARRLLRDAGLEITTDPVGNILGRRPGQVAGLAPLAFGSHIDSVPEGGNYDGAVGAMAAIEVAHTLAERGYRNRHPLLVTIWADEESGLTGSRGFIGDLTADELRRPGRDGVPLGDKLRRIGGDPGRLAAAVHRPGELAAYVELHVEQGGVLDRSGTPIGVVEGIVGINHYDVTLQGFANHAGTTPMDQRRNALLAASELVLAVDRIVRAEPGRQVGTVGRLVVKPGAPNVIPGAVVLTVELRDLSMGKIEMLWGRIRAEAEAIAARHGTSFAYVLEHTNPPAPTHPEVRAAIADAATGLGLAHRLLPSGAGHDAQNLARICPAGMIFVPSVGGISHSPREYTRPEDVERGANVLLQTLLRLDQRP